MERGWEEDGKRMGRGWEEDGKWMGRGWEEDGKRMGRGWGEDMKWMGKRMAGGLEENGEDNGEEDRMRMEGRIGRGRGSRLGGIEEKDTG